MDSLSVLVSRQVFDHYIPVEVVKKKVWVQQFSAGFVCGWAVPFIMSLQGPLR